MATCLTFFTFPHRINTHEGTEKASPAAEAVVVEVLDEIDYGDKDSILAHLNAEENADLSAFLVSHSVANLRTVARTLGVFAGGKKADLVQRVVKYHQARDDEQSK